MATLTLHNTGRQFELNDGHIIQILNAADEDVIHLEELLSIQKRVDNIEETLNQQFYRQRQELTELMSLGKSNTSSILGKIGECHVQNELTKLNIAWEDTSKTPHCADIEIKLENERVLIDVKNYTHPVETSQVTKLYDDCATNNVKYSMLVSLNTPISKKKHFEFETRNGVVMVFVHIQTEYDLTVALNILENIIKTNESQNSPFINHDRIRESIDKINSNVDDVVKVKNDISKLQEYVSKWSRDTLQTINKYQSNTHDIINELKEECMVYAYNEDVDEIRQTFQYKQWIFVLEDLWSRSVDIQYSSNKSKIDFSTTQNGKISIKFQKNEVYVTHTSDIGDCRWTIKSIEQWNLLVSRLFTH